MEAIVTPEDERCMTSGHLRFMCPPYGGGAIVKGGEMSKLFTVLAAMAAITAALAAGTSAQTRTHHFSARVDNQWYPLLAGTRWVYTGVKDGKRTRDVVLVTHRVRKIMGARTIAVSDRLYERGRLEERTTDWYTQDEKGNVWYFGEATAELDRQGHVKNREGSWMAGRNGAKPGIFMPAHPKLGTSFRQEYLKGHAADHFKIIGIFHTVAGANAGGRNGLLTKEWTPLEPGVVDHKMYVRGVGEVLEQSEKGANERGELVGVRRGR
jgi:hypothetical protein